MTERRTNRRLSAILALDVAGYSQIMGEDEAGTVTRLNAIWREVLNPNVDTYGGRIVKMLGDGALIEFASAVQAVDCAIALQNGMADCEAASAEDPCIELRIGVNLGDVIIEGDDILGEGVNIAARLESVAPRGGILVSDYVWNQVRGKTAAEFSDAGAMQLKNIRDPVRAWRWTPPGSAEQTESPPGASASRLGSEAAGFQGSTEIEGPDDGLLELSEPARVVIPTTGGIVRIEDLRKRPRLRTSYAALKGDFRPLPMSGDYHRFVSGPLLAICEDVSCELSLSEPFDSGRSWEFPVLVAHALAEVGKLAGREADGSQGQGDQAGQHGAADPPLPRHLIWATGMVDPELTPVAGDYKLGQKLALSRPLFEQTVAGGGRVSLLLPDGLSGADMTLAEDIAREVGLELHTVPDLRVLQRLVGLRAAAFAGERTENTEVRPSALPAAMPPTLTAGTGHAGADSAHRRPGPFVPIVAGGALVLLLAVGLFASRSSIGVGDWFGLTGTGTERNNLAIEQLVAADQQDCLERLWSRKSLEGRTLRIKNGRATVQIAPSLCGLRFRNAGSRPLTVMMDEVLEDFLVPNNISFASGLRLGVNRPARIIFKRLPAPIEVKLVVAEEGVTDKITLAFEKP